MDDIYISNHADDDTDLSSDPITIEHHYHVDVFEAVIDFQVEELNTRFNDVVIELLSLSSALDPTDKFRRFDADKILKLAEIFYPQDFSGQDIHYLKNQLAQYQLDILNHEKFENLATVSELCQKLFDTKKAKQYNLIDRLIPLVLTLPIFTATTERAFSVMKLVKTVLRNKMAGDYLSVVYIERDIARSISIEAIIVDLYPKKDSRIPV